MERGGIWGAHGVPAPESGSAGAARCVGEVAGLCTQHPGMSRCGILMSLAAKRTDSGSWCPRR